MNNSDKIRTIAVNYLARVEGEGALYVRFENGTLKEVKLKIFEPPRFFEALLRGRKFTEAPDITARICGICPVAYQMSAIHAMERAFNIKIDGSLRELRRLLYCGEWIASHTLHIYMLHAPDFHNCPNVVEMAKLFPSEVEKGLRLKKLGNDLMRLLGGREIHPVNVKVGGFYRVPTKDELNGLLGDMLEAQTLALDTVRWVSKFTFPDINLDYNFVALRHGNEYPFNEGRIVSSNGLDIECNDFLTYFEEEQLSYTTALHCKLRSSKKEDDNETTYHVGPMARYAINFEHLPSDIQQVALSVGLEPICRNPFKSIIVRAIEVLYACSEAVRIIRNYDMPSVSSIAINGETFHGNHSGCAATEAPRGLLYHRYSIDTEGNIADAKIIPPTSQNQRQIEDDLWQVVNRYADSSDEELRYVAEQTIRNYDPCISCATHFLKLEIDRQ